MTTTRSVLALGGAALLLLASCGDDADEQSAVPTATMAPATAAPAIGAPDTAAPVESTISVEGAWARTSPSGVDTGAAYMVITSTVDDRLLSVTVSDEVAMDVQLHESMVSGSMTSDTVMTQDSMTQDSMTGDSTAPMMGMQAVDAIDLPADEPVALEPGGYHIMLMGLAAPLELGSQFVLTLTFEQAGEVEVTVTVADQSPLS